MKVQNITVDDLVRLMRRNKLSVDRQSLWGWLYQLSPPFYALPVIAKCFRMRDYRKLLPDLRNKTVDKQTKCL